MTSPSPSTSSPAQPVLRACRCGIVSTLALRRALGVSQSQLATMMRLGSDAVRVHERAERSGRHQCYPNGNVELLRLWVARDPDLRQRIRLSGLHWPYPEGA